MTITPTFTDGYWWYEDYNAVSPFGLARVLVDRGFDPDSEYEVGPPFSGEIAPTLGGAAEQFAQQIEVAKQEMYARRGRAGPLARRLGGND
jgi:hypothetical protein